jgi:predicted nucleotidyltransferase
MLQKDNRYKVLKVFFDDPMPTFLGFGLREISRKIKVATPSVKRYLEELEKESLILKRIKEVPHLYPDNYYANRNSGYFRFLKKINNMQELKESGLIDYIYEKIQPETIILFGSVSRGEDLKTSDIDLFIQSKEVKIELKPFEKKLKKSINIIFEKDFSKLSSELKNNIINGEILSGYLKVY